MTDTKQKPEVDQLETYKGQWRNLLFDKEGKSYQGELMHDTEQLALDVILINEINMANGTCNAWGVVNGYILNSDYSHTIQMPCGD